MLTCWQALALVASVVAFMLSTFFRWRSLILLKQIPQIMIETQNIVVALLSLIFNTRPRICFFQIPSSPDPLYPRFGRINTNDKV